MTRKPAPRRGPPAQTGAHLPSLYEAGDAAIIYRKLDTAFRCFDEARGLEPNSPRPWMGLAQVALYRGDAKTAREMVAQALRLGAEPAVAHTMIGQMYQFDGAFDDARAAFERAVAADPLHGPAQLALALLAPGGDDAARIDRLRQLAEAPDVHIDHRATLNFALARCLEAQGDDDAAFAAFRRANALRKVQYGAQSSLIDGGRRMAALCTRDFFAERSGFGVAGERPVFIVGMMRSGTSLVEQILASHAAVHGHGERLDILHIARALPAALGASYPECLGRLSAALSARFGGAYLRELQDAAPHALRSLDKLPHNFEHLGLIALLFPQARIIHCSRDPMDACVSNYLQDFGSKNSFTYDLAVMGAHYRAYERLMAHWRDALPNPVLHLRYEALVGDLEGVSRAMVAFLGLDWDPGCLAFQHNRRLVFTKSVVQVRKPLFTDGIGRWRRYARHLGPLIDALGRAPDC